MLAIPEKALVRLSNGLALFIPQGSGRYEVRFVFVGPSIDDVVVIREGLAETVQVVTKNIERLKAVAEDSLRQRRSRW